VFAQDADEDGFSRRRWRRGRGTGWVLDPVELDWTSQEWALDVERVAALRDLPHQVGVLFGIVANEREARRLFDAVAFLDANVFHTPTFFLDPAVTRRIEANGSLDRIGAAQRRILRGLLDDDRMKRMVELEALAPRTSATRDVYTLPEMLADLRGGIWTELGDRSVAIDAFRRNVQRMYLDELDARINPRPTPSNVVIFGPRGEVRPVTGAGTSDIRAAMRAELVTLRTSIDGAIPRAADAETRAHLLDARARIERILDPNK